MKQNIVTTCSIFTLEINHCFIILLKVIFGLTMISNLAKFLPVKKKMNKGAYKCVCIL